MRASRIIGARGSLPVASSHFRLTARKVREGEQDEPLTFFGTDASGYGKATWRLFWTTVISFAVGVVGAVVVISDAYLRRIVEAIGS